MIRLALALKDEPDANVRRNAWYLLADMAEFDGALFEPMSKMVNDSDKLVHRYALGSMQHFGMRSVPILREAQKDSDPYVRRNANHALHRIDPK